MNRDYTNEFQTSLNTTLTAMIEEATAWMPGRVHAMCGTFSGWVSRLNVEPSLFRMLRYRERLTARAEIIRNRVKLICMNEESLDGSYSGKLARQQDELDMYKRYIEKLTGTLGGGRFNADAANQAKHRLVMEQFTIRIREIMRKHSGPLAVIGTALPISAIGAVAGAASGINIGGSLSGDVLSGSVDKKFGAEWDLTKKNAGIEASIGAKGHLAQGKAEGHIGIASGEATVTVGEGSIKGAVGASIFKDGKLNPQLTAEAKAEVIGLKGEVKGQIGNDEFNAHAKATGEVGVANAKAKAGIGMITTTDDAGNTHTGFGAEAKVSAEAYAAKGKVSGGFTLFGIKIDASLEGKAGGAGVSAGGSISTNGVSGEIGAGLGLGAGVKISVDWSDFDIKKLKFW